MRWTVVFYVECSILRGEKWICHVGLKFICIVMIRTEYQIVFINIPPRVSMSSINNLRCDSLVQWRMLSCDKQEETQLEISLLPNACIRLTNDEQVLNSYDQFRWLCILLETLVKHWLQRSCCDTVIIVTSFLISVWTISTVKLVSDSRVVFTYPRVPRSDLVE